MSAGSDPETIDAAGLVVAPGFIDMHSHADHTLPTFPRATNSISQGVTTEVVGLCGFSVAPVAANPARAEQLRELARGFGPYLEWNWHTYADYLTQLEAASPAVNVVPLVGHHALRILAMGLDDRHPTPSELAVMRGSAGRCVEPRRLGHEHRPGVRAWLVRRRSTNCLPSGRSWCAWTGCTCRTCATRPTGW